MDILGDNYLKIDSFYTKLAAGGNLFLRFKGFDVNDNSTEQEVFLTTNYFRSNYSIYPQRVLVGDPTEIINNGGDILRVNFDPDESWLNRYEIRSIVTFIRMSNGQNRFSVKKRPIYF